MLKEKVTAQLAKKPGFIAALDQAAARRPAPLRLTALLRTPITAKTRCSSWSHAMRVRIISAPAFTGDKVIAAILFERTMDGEADGKPVPTYLWQDRGVVPCSKSIKAWPTSMTVSRS